MAGWYGMPPTPERSLESAMTDGSTVRHSRHRRRRSQHFQCLNYILYYRFSTTHDG